MEEELKRQLLELSDDEDRATASDKELDSILEDTPEPAATQQTQDPVPTDMNPEKTHQDGAGNEEKIENAEDQTENTIIAKETVSMVADAVVVKAEHDELIAKYQRLKSNYRKFSNTLFYTPSFLHFYGFTLFIAFIGFGGHS